MTSLQPFTRLSASAVPLLEDNVDTDQIIPARFLKCPREDGYGQFLFHDRRIKSDGSLVSTFVLNQQSYKGARIFVGGENFGCGSSREGAVYALVDYGIRCVIASSFGPIFYKNCFTNGVLPIRVDAEVTSVLASTAAAGGCITVDLCANQIIDSSGLEINFEIEPLYREMLLKGVDELGLTLTMRDDIKLFENEYLKKFWFLEGAEQDG